MSNSGTVSITLPWSALASSNERHRLGGGKGYHGHSARYLASLDAIHMHGLADLRWARVPVPAFPTGPVSVRLKFYPPNRVRRDESNLLKGILDGLNRVAWADDSQVTEWHGSRHPVDTENPRVELELREAEL